MTKKQLGSLIQRSLGVRQISRQELAKFLNLHISTIGYWCSGKYLPSPCYQDKLLQYLEEKDKKFKENPIKLLKEEHFSALNNQKLKKKQLIMKKNKKALERKKKLDNSQIGSYHT